MRWPVRSGARELQKSSGVDVYAHQLVAGAISEEDEEQLLLDVERSAVDGLDELYLAPMDEASVRLALHRLLRAWCFRHPGGYCQGMNFVAMVLLVVMQYGVPPTGDDDDEAERQSAAEEDAFWTFAAINELLLPADFYAAPDMPGMQRDARVLFELFLLARRGGEIPGRSLPTSAADGAIGDEQWRDILRLAAYKWFVPCFVNQLPLDTLLLYWDKVFLRLPSPPAPTAHSPAPTPALASPLAVLPTGRGLSCAHLSLALALIMSAIDEAGEAMMSEREEGRMGIGFNRLLESANTIADGPALLATASSKRFRISAQQLQYLRARLQAAPRAGAGEPSLSGMQASALWLMRRPDSMPLRVLKQTMLLAPPNPPPLTVAQMSVGFYYPRLCSTCALTAMAFCVWVARGVLPASLGRRAF